MWYMSRDVVTMAHSFTLNDTLYVVERSVIQQDARTSMTKALSKVHLSVSCYPLKRLRYTW